MHPFNRDFPVNSLNALLQAARNLYGERLLAFAIFGSYARGSANENSDLDLFLVIEDLPAGRFARVEEWMGIERVWMEEILLSPVFFTLDELKEGTPLLLDMTEGEVRILFERDGVLANRLAELKHRLREMGARKMGRGKSSYWIMGPKSGREVIL